MLRTFRSSMWIVMQRLPLILSLLLLAPTWSGAAAAAAVSASPDPNKEAHAAAQDLVVTLAVEQLCTGGKRRILAPPPQDGPPLEDRLAEQFRHRYGLDWGAALGPPGTEIIVRATVRISQPLIADLDGEKKGALCVDNRMRLLRALEVVPGR